MDARYAGSRGQIRVVAWGMLLVIAVAVAPGGVDWAAVGGWVESWAVLLVLVLPGVWLLGSSAYSLWRTSRPHQARRRMQRAVPLSWWAVAAASVVIAVVTWRATRWLLDQAAAADDPAAARMEALKTGLGIGAAIGGLFALLLAVRRQWHHEIIATDTAHDASERRVTELYTKAVEQLGSDKAPVRLGAMYALERLAQDSVEQRQTIANVLCAYLRMPYTLPGDEPADDGEPGNLGDQDRLAANERSLQEREVRLAAQRILLDHLRSGILNEPEEKFWDGIELDLAGATLISFDLSYCTLGSCRFNRTKFVEGASFINTVFTKITDFTGAVFTGDALFEEASFTGFTFFADANFTEEAKFTGATFASKTKPSKGSFLTRVISPDDLPRPLPVATDFRNTKFERGVPSDVERFM